jgi:hypothetical protein
MLDWSFDPRTAPLQAFGMAQLKGGSLRQSKPGRLEHPATTTLYIARPLVRAQTRFGTRGHELVRLGAIRKLHVRSVPFEFLVHTDRDVAQQDGELLEHVLRELAQSTRGHPIGRRTGRDAGFGCCGRRSRRTASVGSPSMCCGLGDLSPISRSLERTVAPMAGNRSSNQGLVLPTLMPLPKLVTHISAGWKGLNWTRRGCLKP